jgi:hypothetical protein
MTNPTAVDAKIFKPPSVKAGPASRRGPFKRLPIINWLPWVVLPVIAWLLVLLALTAWRLVRRTKMYQNSRLSTTIS